MSASLGQLGAYYQVGDPNGPGVSDFLDLLHKYDPNASYVPISQNAGGGEGGAPASGTIYQLSFNPSKLPGFDGTGSLSAATSSLNGQYGGGPNFLPAAGNPLTDPTKITHSSVYGDITDPGNVPLPVTHSWLDYSPLLVAAFGGALGGFGAGGLLGGSDASGLGASDPFLSGGTGSMDMTGSYGTGLPGSLGSNLGGAESSLYGAGALDNPAGALGGSGAGAGASGGLSQADWDKIIAGQPENGSFVGPNGTDPNGFTPGDYNDLNSINAGLDNPFNLSNLTSKLPSLLQKLPGLLGGGTGTGTGAGGGSGGGGGGGNLLVNAGQQQRPQAEDAAAILARLYSQRSGLLGAR